MKVAAVVVAHRSAARLPGLLGTLGRAEPGVQVVVVDSGSPGGPPAVPPSVHLVALDDNVGFGRAGNAGVAAAGDEWDVVALLNPDVRLAGPSLTELAAALADRPDVGVATGPVVDAEGTRSPSAWGPTSALRAFWFASGWRLPRARRLVGRLAGRAGGALTSSRTLVEDDLRVDGHVLGGAMVVRRACWDELGGFDPRYFLYWEDADLCHRARALGWEVRVLPCTPIVHEAGTSSEGVVDAQRWDWYVEGADVFASEHLTPWRRLLLLGALRLGRAMRR
jgi:N-acetylglucosaminyl-diphospho-decaprenol L-rhamnosyltransferase